MPINLLTNSEVSPHQIVQAIVTVIAVINPVVCGTIFLTVTPKLTQAQRRWAAAKVALSILIILVGSALIGLKVLGIFNISIDVFQIVGGSDHRLYGIRYARRRSYCRSSTAYE